MKNKQQKFFVLVFIPAMLLGPLAAAQQPTPESSLPVPMPSPAETQTTPSPSGHENMDKMASTVTRAAEMCETMMKKEMAAAPYKMVACIGFGVLLLIALVLFVILEVQWIKYWHRKLQSGKENRS